MKKIILLGCTGSIGSTAITMLEEYQDRIQIVGLSANKRYFDMYELALKFNCKSICTPCIDHDFSALCKKSGITLYHDNMVFIDETEADLVLNGISSAVGLNASIAALSSGKDLALANKESVVMAGNLLKKLAAKKGKRIIPVDSEHSAIYELQKAFGAGSLDKILITASGGPFLNRSKTELRNVTVEEAAHHPTWNMGRKVSIDSATLANKALEVIEAARLFDFPPEKIITVIHPQSTVHSMVSLKNGQTYAQLSAPTMRFPILNSIFEAFGFEFEKPLNTPLFELGEKHIHLDFYPMDFERFPLVKCGFECLRLGGYYPLLFNAANEVAVEAFCEGQIRFDQIEDLVQMVMEKAKLPAVVKDFKEVYAVDAAVRAASSALVSKL